MAGGIKDKVAIIGMGCSKFGERWEADVEDLIVEAYQECIADAAIGTEDIGAALRDVLDGFVDADGRVPSQIDGGLKCFGHPIRASGLRMIYELYLQLHGRAGDRQVADPKLGLTHNLGGAPHQNVCSVAIIGHHGA